MDNIATSLTGKHEPIDKPKRIDIQLYFTNDILHFITLYFTLKYNALC